MLSSVLNWLRDYKAAPDPQAQLTNTVALIVAGNQPFYPLYLAAIVGSASWPAWITLLTMPLFAAVPAVTRRHALWGRVMLPVVGTVNGVLAAKLIGLDTGVELFLLPCVLLGALLYRPGQRILALAITALPFAAFLVIDPVLGPPLVSYSAAEYRSVISMHAISVASLLAVIGFMLAA